ncbi:uncharacterized protein LOC8266943 [Ricinus communis]|uniref:DNA binding protein, putative n=1 Tax=Ricinus communis TaxID=3988 RepID=B9S9Q9_RICCO|nr:uncharacterized protein LOC8266943 [Ricinus communis]EEF39579.1 DNA binding protein, putative [Ricinus communis]|eukprot:XP_015577045.1 uncharacterized protein LOC8266943 [Ricinus communis]
MTGSGHYFVEWKEQFVSQERGNRVVHYFLKDSAGESILAVVGTERSVRHMFYVVAEEFVQAYGTEHSIHAGFKWRSRREVVDWLTSMLSKQHLQGDRSKSPKHDLTQVLESPEYSMNGLGHQQTQGRLSRNLSGHNSDIIWSGIAWACGKQLKHYPAFCRNGITIAIQSFVFVMAKGENHYLAYLEDMYEDKRGQKKVKVRWFHHNQEVKGVVPLRNAHPMEVFITPYSQVISAECVDGPAIVLTREHYEECLAAFPDALSTRIHLCFRQFRSNKIKPFDLSKLRGYFDQPILSCLNSKSLPGVDSISYGLTGEEDEEFSPDDNVKLGAKRTRSGKSETFVTGHSGIGISGNQMMSFGPSYLNIRFGISGKRLLPLKNVASQLRYSPLFKVDEKIELLCQDSGIRGCWFRCTVLHVSRKQIKVQYDDLRDEDEYGNLEEWIPAFKVAVPDKLGMRFSGRPTIRPVPPQNEQTDHALEIGSAVDAWWSDGWWEGVVTGIDSSTDDILQVYFPGESFFLSVHKKDLRISRDWMGNQWIDIQAKPDILPAISAAISPGTKTSMSPAIAKDLKSDGHAISCNEGPASAELDSIEEKKADTATLASTDSIPENMDCDDDKMPPLSDDKADEDGGNDINVDHDKVDKIDSNDEDQVDGDIKGKDDKLDIEVFDASDKNCKAVELMEVTA